MADIKNAGRRIDRAERRVVFGRPREEVRQVSSLVTSAKGHGLAKGWLMTLKHLTKVYVKFGVQFYLLPTFSTQSKCIEYFGDLYEIIKCFRRCQKRDCSGALQFQCHASQT